MFKKNFHVFFYIFNVLYFCLSSLSSLFVACSIQIVLNIVSFGSYSIALFLFVKLMSEVLNVGKMLFLIVNDIRLLQLR